MYVREALGTLVGWLTAPAFGAVAVARHARVFHPEGVVVAGRVEPITVDSPEDTVAERLRGWALVRFSTALWRRGKEWPDALGCAIRFRYRPLESAEPDPGDQDLLLATVRTPLATPLGAAGTDAHDFLSNVYFGTASFDVPGLGRAKWRAVPDQASVHGTNRTERLLDGVAQGDAELRLEVRRRFKMRWIPVARVHLERVVEIDQDQLRFSPFRSGRGILPRGFVHALRRGAYRVSQVAGHPGSRAAA
jgi:hypothetical protein